MTKEDEADVQRLLKNVDVTELMDMLMKHGNRYSRRILKFFRWLCKYMPVILMCFHAYGIWEFSQHHREMLFLMQRMRLATSTSTLWCMFCLWWLFWLADSSFCVGDTEYHFSTFSASTQLTSWNGVGTQPTI